MNLLNFFKKKLKNIDDSYVFDKADYHAESIEEWGFDDDQVFVHTGMFLAWLVSNNMMSDFFIKESEDESRKLKSREISPSELYMNWDGVLVGDMLNKEGFNFACDYFDFKKGAYLEDYAMVFWAISNLDIFNIKDTWENFDKLKPTIDSRYKKWKTWYAI